MCAGERRLSWRQRSLSKSDDGPVACSLKPFFLAASIPVDGAETRVEAYIERPLLLHQEARTYVKREKEETNGAVIHSFKCSLFCSALQWRDRDTAERQRDSISSVNCSFEVGREMEQRVEKLGGPFHP